MNKDVKQSTTYPWSYNSYLPNNAVDKNITTCIRTDGMGGLSPDQTVWWKVDLGGVYNIYSVNILYKNYDGHGIALFFIICHYTCRINPLF